MRDAVIVDIVRTASGRGKAGGAVSSTHPVDLLAATLRAMVERTGIDSELIEDVVCGCVSRTGQQSVNIGRHAVLAAGFPESVPATTIDRQCGSSQQAMHFVAQGVQSGAYDVAIACGVESMSRAPMFFNTQGQDYLGAGVAARYPEGLVPQGISAELIAQRWKLDRETLDEYSARSHQRAAAAAAGKFNHEIIPANTLGEDGVAAVHVLDQTVRPRTTTEGLAGLRPSFKSDVYADRFPGLGWHITPGNSSPVSDGASAALIMGADTAATLGLTPRARFHSFAVSGDDPVLMLMGVLPATRRALSRVGMDISELDAYEVNEAFAPVPLAWAHEFGVDPELLNPRGGAIALGHSLGASGIRLMATMCEGGGMANATLIERL